jgi:hypothetical protein
VAYRDKVIVKEAERILGGKLLGNSSAKPFSDIDLSFLSDEIGTGEKGSRQF